MADNLDDGEFWLPPHFLTDDCTPLSGTKNVDAKNFDVFSASFPSGFSSPVESVMWSSKTDLTQHMTHQLDLDLSQNSESPNSVYHLNTHRATWDLLYAAAGEVEKMRLMVPPKKPSTVIQTNSGVGFYTQQYGLAHQQFQIAKFGISEEQEMEQQHGLVWGNTNTTMQLNGCSGNYQWGQSNNHMVANRVRNIDGGVIEVGTNMSLSSCPWPQIQYGCGMSAVNLGNPPVQRESIGTGVFLPHRVVQSPVKSKKKQASSNVSVRTRVLQAQDSKQLHHHSNEALYIDYESAFPKIRSNYGISQQKRNKKHQPPRVKTQLPQEWMH